MLYFLAQSLVIVTSSKKLIKFVRHDLLLVNPGQLSTVSTCQGALMSLSRECGLVHKYRDFKAVFKRGKALGTGVQDLAKG